MGIPEVEHSADPAAAGRLLERLADVAPEQAGRVDRDEELRTTLVTVGAASPWLARLCLTDPDAIDILAGIDAPPRRWPMDTDLVRLKRLGMLRIAARDLTGRAPLERVVEALSGLADDVLDRAWRQTPKAGGMAVIAMGKLGGRELNYASDVDVMLVGAGGRQPTTPQAARVFLDRVRPVWRIDVDLRPEGRSGALVRSLDSYASYWERWAETWEFQALLKARAAAGDRQLGDEFISAASALVWGRPFDGDDLVSLRTMKRRAEEEIDRRGLAERELKRGRGGIRDIEFAVQLLQMVHGREDASLRSRATLPALAALAAGGYVDRADAEALEEAYRFFRTVEHRLQLVEDQQVHSIPSGEDARAHLARVLGYRDGPMSTARGQFEAELRRHQATGRSIHERLFFRPLLEAFTAQPGRAPLGEDAATERLAAFGFSDAERTRQAVAELTRGFSRSSHLMRQMLPLVFEWLSQSPDPDLGLLGLRSLTTGEHRRNQLTTVFRESAEAARQLCLLLGTGPRFARTLERHPDLMTHLASGAERPLSGPDLIDLGRRSTAWRSGRRGASEGLIALRNREELRIAAADILGRTTVDETGRSLTELAESILVAGVDIVDPQVPFAVIAMGRLGGSELSYASDLDVMFVFDPEADEFALPAGAPVLAGGVAAHPHHGDEPAPARVDRAPSVAAEAAATALVKLIGGDTPAHQVYPFDVGLRPEGRQGPLARSLKAFATYYERWAETWERQALLRGRFVAGDERVGARFGELARRFVWERPLTDDQVREIRRNKARVEAERIPAGEDPEFHLKLGRGSLTDIEWAVQLLQLQNGVRATGTLEGLSALTEAGIVVPGDAEVLADSYRFCEQTRNRLFLIRGSASDALPAAGHQLNTLARSLGTSPSGLREDYRRLTRRARRVAGRLFWGID